MADAPSGGGSGWGPFEIILGLLLAISLISAISNHGKLTPTTAGTTTTTKKEVVTTADTSENRCGLSVTAPLSLQNVTDSVHLSGSVQGCNWNPDGSTVLFAQVVNGGGAPVSAFVAVQDSGDSFLYNAFDTTIPVTGNQSGTGYLILIPAKSGEKAISIRIPLHFVKK